MYKAISVESLGITIPLAHNFTEQQCHELMSQKYPGVESYVLEESYEENQSCNW